MSITCGTSNRKKKSTLKFSDIHFKILKVGLVLINFTMGFHWQEKDIQSQDKAP